MKQNHPSSRATREGTELPYAVAATKLRMSLVAAVLNVIGRLVGLVAITSPLILLLLSVDWLENEKLTAKSHAAAGTLPALYVRVPLEEGNEKAEVSRAIEELGLGPVQSEVVIHTEWVRTREFRSLAETGEALAVLRELFPGTIAIDTEPIHELRAVNVTFDPQLDEEEVEEEIRRIFGSYEKMMAPDVQCAEGTAQVDWAKWSYYDREARRLTMLGQVIYLHRLKYSGKW